MNLMIDKRSRWDESISRWYEPFYEATYYTTTIGVFEYCVVTNEAVRLRQALQANKYVHDGALIVQATSTFRHITTKERCLRSTYPAPSWSCVNFLVDQGATKCV